ncbi:MAG: hypothetical protein ABFE08_14810 [Armatimonadia bacterium]
MPSLLGRRFVSGVAFASFCILRLSVAVWAQPERQVPPSITAGARAGTFNVQAHNVPLADFLRAVAKATNSKVVFGAEVEGKRVMDWNWKDLRVDQMLATIARSHNLALRQDNGAWAFSPGDTTPRVDIGLKIIDLLTADDAVAWDGYRLPGNIAILRGRFNPQLNALLSAGRATVLNEPHVAAQSGQAVQLDFAMKENGEAPKPSEFPEFTYTDVGSRFVIVPVINPDATITLSLSLQTTWTNAGKPLTDMVTPPKRQSQPDDMAMILEFPGLRMGNSEQILLCGWQALCGQPRQDGRDRILVLQATVH